jgi:PTS system nitrogen regulatory IIA component
MRLRDWFRPRPMPSPGPAAPGAALRGLVLPRRVALDAVAYTGHDALSIAAALLTESDPAAARAVLQALAERERLGSTALGHGCAVPHARIDALDRPAAAFVRTAAPVPFDAPDGRGVSLFLVLLVPGDADEFHLALLAAAAERFGDRRFVDGLRRAATPHDLVALFDA